jgi:peptidyl-prolyl cis-trans isomerase SurA
MPCRTCLPLQGEILLQFDLHGILRQNASGLRLSPTQLVPALGLALLIAMVPAGCKRAHGPAVVAVVNGKEIQRSEVEKYYQQQLGESQQQPSKEQADILRLSVLRQLIDEEIVQQRAAKLNLVASDADVDAKVNELKAPFTQEEFNKRLQQKNLTLEDLRRDYRRSLTDEKLFNKEINSKINVTDSDISNYYNAHKADFNLIEPQYRLSQIVVTTAPAPQAGNLENSKATNEAEAKKKIEMLHARLESGDDFGAIAAHFSENPQTSANGGDMGFVAESALHSNPAVYAAMSKLNPGQITEPLPSYDPASKRLIGYAIYKLVSKDAAGQRELNDPRVQQTIRQTLRDGRAQLLKNAYYDMLRDQSHVENYFAEDIFKNSAQ